MTLRNLTTTLDEGRISTWRLPRRSALTMFFWNQVIRDWARQVTGNVRDNRSVRQCQELHATTNMGTLLTRTDTRTMLNDFGGTNRTDIGRKDL
jgi:hypothetical protein